MNSNHNVLVTSGGKWVGMLVQLREAMHRVADLSEGRIMVASMEELTPAGCFADATFVVPPIRDDMYIDCLLNICKENQVRVLIPLIDPDLERLCRHLGAFEKLGTAVVCPPADLVELCFDKLLFQQFAEEEGLHSPQAYSVGELQDSHFPVFIKRRRGFGSIGSAICESLEQAMTRVVKNDGVIIQRFVDAKEVSVDAFISGSGECVVRVQRVRDKVVAGEAYRSRTVNIPAIRDLAIRTISALTKRGIRGPLNIQIFDSDPPLLIEVNTRLGSASVLSNVASNGRLFHAVLSEACGHRVKGDPDDYVINLSMYRYLGEVFHQGPHLVKIIPQ